MNLHNTKVDISIEMHKSYVHKKHN